MTAPVPTSRTAHIARKFALGYLPCTALVIVPAWVMALANPSPGPAGWAGAIVLAIWSIQVAICNLLILFLRWTLPARFAAKAMLVTALSVALLPSLLFARHEVRLLVMGEPDLALHLRQRSSDDCTLLQVLRVNRINDTARTVQAEVHCGAGKIRETCDWYFVYREEAGAWVNPHRPQCR